MNGGVGGVGPPLDNSTDTQTPQCPNGTPNTGHTPATIHIQLPYAHTNDAGAPDKSAPTNELLHTIPSHPRMQAGAMSDKDKSQRSPTLGLGAGNKWSQQEDTPGGYQCVIKS